MGRKSFVNSDFLKAEGEIRMFESNEEILRAWEGINKSRLASVTFNGYRYEVVKFMESCGDVLVSTLTRRHFWRYLEQVGSKCRYMTRRNRAFGGEGRAVKGEYWCEKKLPMIDCGPVGCSQYNPVAVQTIEKHLDAIVTLYDVLTRAENIPYNFVRDLKREWLKDNKHRRRTNVRRVPTQEELEKMINHTPYLVRKTLLLLAAKTGARVGELVELRFDQEHYRPEEGWLKIPDSRGGNMQDKGKRRGNPYLIVDKQMYNHLKEYELQRAEKLKRMGYEREHLFLNHAGNPFTTNSVNRRVIWPEAIRCGIMRKDAPRGERLTSHGFRHFFSDFLKKRRPDGRGGIDPYWWNVLRGDIPSGNENEYVHPKIEDLKKEYLAYAPVFDVADPRGIRDKREKMG